MEKPTGKVRVFMKLVAIMALTFGAGLVVMRRIDYLSGQYQYHLRQLVAYQDEIHRDPRTSGRLPNATLNRRAAWHKALMEKYAAACDRTWLPVAADPPMPTPW